MEKNDKILPENEAQDGDQNNANADAGANQNVDAGEKVEMENVQKAENVIPKPPPAPVLPATPTMTPVITIDPPKVQKTKTDFIPPSKEELLDMKGKLRPVEKLRKAKSSSNMTAENLEPDIWRAPSQESVISEDGRTKQGRANHARLIQQLQEMQNETRKRIDSLLTRTCTLEKREEEVEYRCDKIEEKQDTLEIKIREVNENVQSSSDVLVSVVKDQQKLTQLVEEFRDMSNINRQEIHHMKTTSAPGSQTSARSTPVHTHMPSPLQLPVSNRGGANLSTGKLFPPSFDGKGTPTKFMKELEDYCGALGLADWQLQCVLSTSLKGPANDWWHFARDQVTSLEKFKKLFLERFWDDNVQYQVIDDLRFGHYNENGKLNRVEYAIKKINNAKSLVPPPCEREMIKLLSRHFPADVHRVAVLGLVQDTQSLLKLLGEIDSTDRNTAKRNNNNNSNNSRQVNNSNKNGNGNFQNGNYNFNRNNGNYNNPRYSNQENGQERQERPENSQQTGQNNRYQNGYQNGYQNRGYYNQGARNYQNNYSGNRPNQQANNYQGQRNNFQQNRPQGQQNTQNNYNRDHNNKSSNQNVPVNVIKSSGYESNKDEDHPQELVITEEEEAMLQQIFPENSDHLRCSKSPKY